MISFVSNFILGICLAIAVCLLVHRQSTIRTLKDYIGKFLPDWVVDFHLAEEAKATIKFCTSDKNPKFHVVSSYLEINQARVDQIRERHESFWKEVWLAQTAARILDSGREFTADTLEYYPDKYQGLFFKVFVRECSIVSRYSITPVDVILLKGLAMVAAGEPLDIALKFVTANDPELETLFSKLASAYKENKPANMPAALSTEEAV